jgi:choline dehydrogenase-like flavoprotein
MIANSSGRYALRYHAEPVPNPESRVYLGSDAAADQGVTVDFRYLPDDMASVVRAHDVLDDALRRSGLGYLEYWPQTDARADAVQAQALDGYHQVGTTRMGSDAELSVVDLDCRVHGFDNLYVASSSVFPTADSANPTFPMVALALRLAHHIISLPR